MTKPLCIYHGNCFDGFTAAWAVWKRFGNNVDFFEGHYGVEPPDVTGRDVIIVDFSYKRPVLMEMAKVARTIFVLDHHKTAAEDLDGFLSARSYEPDDLIKAAEFDATYPIRVNFDMNRSGSRAALSDHYCQPSDRYWLISGSE